MIAVAIAAAMAMQSLMYICTFNTAQLKNNSSDMLNISRLKNP